VVTKNAIKKHIQTAFVGFVDQCLRLCQGTKLGVYRKIITGEVPGGVQPALGQVRRADRQGMKNGGQPNGIHPQSLDVIKRLNNAQQVALVGAGAVTHVEIGRRVAVNKGLHHDLVGAQIADVIGQCAVTGQPSLGRLSRHRDDDGCVNRRW